MSAGNTFENDLMKLILNGTAIADLAENDTSSPLTSLYVSLHTADPGEAGDQTTNETSYTGYARVAVTRDTNGFTVTNNVGSNAATISFGLNTSGTPTITHVAVGTASSGAGKILVSGALSSSLAMQVGFTPQFVAGELDLTCD